ncbi:MAG: A24 family peptidase [Myxococcales bacterium]|nr:A24 family peptidase [Polyangiaceae bacterium]MDW8248669.1 A24 family peptidase [Myxococcales bacterium]
MVLPVQFLMAAVLITAAAALIDWRTGHIPNGLTLGPLAVAPLLHAILAFREQGITAAGMAFGWSALGAIACGIAPLLIWLANGGGGGDLKLMAALGALLGPMVGLEAETYMFVGATLYSMAWMAYRGQLLRTLGNTMMLVVNPFLPKEKRRELPEAMMTKLRFGPSIFAGTCLAAYLNWRA